MASGTAEGDGSVAWLYPWNRPIGRCAILVMLTIGTPCGAADPMPEPVTTPLPSGVYKLDPAHASLLFRADHLGMSRYTARFTRFAAELELDPANPGAARLAATVDPRSLETDNSDPAYDFDAILQGPDWLNAARFPQITFRSTKVELTGSNSALVTGELGLHGITAPITLETTFNGGYASFALDPSGSRIGFSARGTLMRSAFGIAFGIPAGRLDHRRRRCGRDHHRGRVHATGGRQALRRSGRRRASARAMVSSGVTTSRARAHPRRTPWFRCHCRRPVGGSCAGRYPGSRRRLRR